MKVKQFLFGAMPESNSEAGSLNALDWKKTGRSLVVVCAGALLTAFFDFLVKWLGDTDFGKYQVIVGLVLSSGLLELGRRYLADHLAVYEQ